MTLYRKVTGRDALFLNRLIPRDINFTGLFLFSIFAMEEKFIGDDIVIIPDKPAAL